MTMLKYASFAIGLCLYTLAPAAERPVLPSANSTPPIVIAHRGASGLRPEHTLEAYRLAAEQGADYLEPDLVFTKDGVLIARHENEIGGTTDVASRAEFASRKRTQAIDGASVTGWFTEDFTLAEIRTLRARERLPELRTASAAYDGRFLVPTFEEILDLVDALNVGRAVPLGLYPETKHPTHFEARGHSFDRPLLDALARHGYRDRSAPVFIQSFESGNLRRLRALTTLRLTQLVDDGEAIDPKEIAAYANVIGAPKGAVIPRTADARLASPTSLVKDAHAAGLAVHVYTFRAENAFLPLECRRGDERAALGDLSCELSRFLDAGIDGFFSDHTLDAVAVRNARPR